MNPINAFNGRLTQTLPTVALKPPPDTETFRLANAADQKTTAVAPSDATQLNAPVEVDPDAVRNAFDEFVGQTFYSQMLSSLRKTTGKPAYLHGGRGEEVFRGQLDQIIVEDLTKATKGQFTGPMFELMNLPRS